ncbi:MAG TPA: tetratricopeptide repeat protein [bacterium]|nr:tetratricopeptide repeat protein [bacterium]
MTKILSAEEAAAYVTAVEQLVNGHPAEALPLLEPLTRDSPSAEILLALAKCYLELRRAADAHNCLRKILQLEVPIDAGLRAYVLLLDGYASALVGEMDLAQEALVEVAEHDSRLDATVRSLRRQIQAGRKPLLRL